MGSTDAFVEGRCLAPSDQTTPEDRAALDRQEGDRETALHERAGFLKRNGSGGHCWCHLKAGLVHQVHFGLHTIGETFLFIFVFNVEKALTPYMKDSDHPVMLADSTNQTTQLQVCLPGGDSLGK